MGWLRRLFLVVIGSGILLIIAGGILWWFGDQPLLSPITQSSSFQFLIGAEPKSTSDKVVYGFLPYWNLNKTQLQPELTQVAYFSLTIDSQGNVVTRTEDGTEPGYSRLQSEGFLDLAQAATADQTQVELVLTQFDNDDIQALLTNPQAQEQLMLSLDSALLAYPFSGVNIDIEYTGPNSQQLQPGLVNLTTLMRRHLNQKYSGMKLSIDVYANAATRPTIWDVAKIGEQVDYVIVMAYDFHRRSSPQAGPVAPLFGGQTYWESDINTHLQNFVKVVPNEKILLGVPFYGYGWQTTSTEAQALTYPDSGSTASFERVQELMSQASELNLQTQWNEEALSPYLTYEVDGETYVIYYENSRSLSYKLDYVNQLDLGGIAIWALGYEGDSRELWDVIETKL